VDPVVREGARDVIAKLLNIVSALALATLLAAGGFVGYLFGTGHLNAGRIELVARVLRGQLDQVPHDEPVPAASAAATQPAPQRLAPSPEEMQAQRQRERLTSLELERAASDLDARRRLLDQALQHVIQEQERLAEDKKRSEVAAEQKKTTEAGLDEGFKKEVELVSSLQPRQAKEHVLRVWKKQPADAVRLLEQMDESRVKRILEQLKTTEELQIQTDLLEQIRLHGIEAHANASGMTNGAAAP
jgi:hypothetical protein